MNQIKDLEFVYRLARCNEGANMGFRTSLHGEPRLELSQPEAAEWVRLMRSGKSLPRNLILEAFYEGKLEHSYGPSSTHVVSMLDVIPAAWPMRPGLYLEVSRAYAPDSPDEGCFDDESVCIGPIVHAHTVWGCEVNVCFETEEDAARYFGRIPSAWTRGPSGEYDVVAHHQTEFNFPIVNDMIDVGIRNRMFSDWTVYYSKGAA